MTPEEHKRVEAALGDGREICHRCHATLATYADVCAADLDDRCPGFEAIERAALPPEACPVCGGDCGSANPPVVFCPMRDTSPERT